MAMPSNEHQAVGWMVVLAIPIMILGWIGEKLAFAWNLLTENIGALVFLGFIALCIFLALRSCAKEARKTAAESKAEWEEIKILWSEVFRRKSKPSVSTGGNQQQKTDGRRQANDDFDPSRFGAKPSPEMPYGIDKRHKDDTPLWAYVDDPKAPPPLRREAFEKILKREAFREGTTGREIVVQPW